MSMYPFHVVLIVKAAILSGAQSQLRRLGLGPSLTRKLIRKTDPNNAAPSGYAALIRCTAADRTALQARAEAAGNNAFIFWSTDRKKAKQKAMAFISRKGYRIKPSSG